MAKQNTYLVYGLLLAGAGVAGYYALKRYNIKKYQSLPEYTKTNPQKALACSSSNNKAIVWFTNYTTGNVEVEPLTTTVDEFKQQAIQKIRSRWPKDELYAGVCLNGSTLWEYYQPKQ